MAVRELFHGTRQRFAKFDTSFKGTGEAGKIDACWFTDNFEGAKNHAILKNRHVTPPLVYRCELSSEVLLADYSIPLSEQPHILKLLNQHLPVSISTSLGRGKDWDLNHPCYQSHRGRTILTGTRGLDSDEIIKLFKTCGVHGVHDWEGIFTDAYLKGTTTVIFDVSVLIIKEIIEV